MQFTSLISRLLLALTLLLPASASARQAATENAQPVGSTAKSSVAKRRPSSSEIADAKAKGLVWVNTATRVYHKEGPSYGTTSRGKFMSEDDARKAGFRIASDSRSKK